MIDFSPVTTQGAMLFHFEFHGTSGKGRVSSVGLNSRHYQKVHLAPILNIPTKFQFPGLICEGEGEGHARNKFKKYEKLMDVHFFFGTVHIN